MLSRRGLTLGIILLSCSAVRAGRHRAAAGDEDPWPQSVPRARCASRCLSLHSLAAVQTAQQCLEPCKESWEMKRKSSCREMCERAFPNEHWECVTSCEFLWSVLTAKQGACPRPERASGFDAACVEGCDRDGDCPAQKKCCSNDCGHTCQNPKDLYKGVPLKPRKELAFEELPSGQFSVRWSSRFNVSAEPVIHVLQRRWNFGIQPSEDTATSWEVVAQTTEQRTRLSDIRPGRWYQFRVAAVNTHGTRGFTTPSKHVHSRSDPSLPPAPLDLRVANMTSGPGRAVSATVLWTLPADLDVPVHHYLVSWSWTAGGRPATSSGSKRKKTVRENHVELDSMRSNRSYSVEVQAVSYWGQTQLKGRRAVLQFNTQPAITTTFQTPKREVLDVGTPFYQDGRLRVHVYWRTSTDPSVEFYRVQWGPEYCAHNRSGPMEKIRTKESFISLKDLLFSCKYKVSLQPVGKRSRPPVEATSFHTPSCAVIQSKSTKPIGCRGDAAAPPQKVPVKAANLTAAFEIHGGTNVTAVFSWDVSEVPPDEELFGYRVTWSEVIPTTRLHGNKLAHSLVSQSQILPPDGSVLVVPGLKHDSLYQLDVEAMTQEGEGPVTSRVFQTPGYQSLPKHRKGSRSRRLHHKQPI